MTTNPPCNGQFGASRHFRNSRRPVAPEPLYRTRRGRGRTATRGVTTSSSVLADTLEGEEPVPGGEDRADGGQHEEIYSVTVSAMASHRRMNLFSPTELS